MGACALERRLGCAVAHPVPCVPGFEIEQRKRLEPRQVRAPQPALLEVVERSPRLIRRDRRARRRAGAPVDAGPRCERGGRARRCSPSRRGCSKAGRSESRGAVPAKRSSTSPSAKTHRLVDSPPVATAVRKLAATASSRSALEESAATIRMYQRPMRAGSVPDCALSAARPRPKQWFSHAYCVQGARDLPCRGATKEPGDMTTRFRVNSPNVIHETIEGEVILIDLRTGTYYSLRDAGALVWQVIERGDDVDGVTTLLEQWYEASDDEIGAGVRRLLEGFRSEGLIRVSEEPSDAPAASQFGAPRHSRALRGTCAREAHGHAGSHSHRPGPRGECRRVSRIARGRATREHVSSASTTAFPARRARRASRPSSRRRRARQERSSSVTSPFAACPCDCGSRASQQLTSSARPSRISRRNRASSRR